MILTFLQSEWNVSNSTTVKMEKLFGKCLKFFKQIYEWFATAATNIFAGGNKHFPHFQNSHGFKMYIVDLLHVHG